MWGSEPRPHLRVPDLSAWRVPVLGVLLLLGACKEVPGPRYVTSGGADAHRGKALIEQAACGACHQIGGIAWPRGRLGPSLVNFNDIGLIAGALPNTPENLAHFIRNAPEAKPGSTMPPMPVTDAEARDVAAYLHSLNDGGEDK